MTTLSVPSSWQLAYHGFDRLYAHGRIILLRERLRVLLSFLPTEGRLIDVGCGIGVVAHLIADERPNLVIIGIDKNPRRIEVAQKTITKKSRVSFAVGDARTFPFEHGDTVLFLDVFHHIAYEAHESLLLKLRDDLGTQGKIFIDDVATIPRWKHWCAYAIDILLYPLSTHCQFYNPTQMQALLQKTGWRMIGSVDTSMRSPLPTHLYVGQ